jgi:hypothetical protein
MNCFSKNYNFISIIFFFLNINIAIADQCPSAETVKERKISREYDWSIDERQTLEDVLAVEKLYSVRIKNRGEFVACYYTSNNRSLRLDGTGIEENCTINKKSGDWIESENGEQVCKEPDLSQCIYEMHCEKVE